MAGRAQCRRAACRRRYHGPARKVRIDYARGFPHSRRPGHSAQLTRVTLHHTGWGDGGEWDKAFDYFRSAWPQVLGNLKKRFDGRPQDWTQWMEQLRKWHAEPKAADSGASK